MYELKNTLNANTLESTDTLEVESCDNLIMYIIDNSGSHNNHIIQLYVSPNNEDWIGVDCSVTGIGSNVINVHLLKYVKATVITKEGSSSEVDIYLQAI